MMKMKKLMLAVAFATAMTAMAETEYANGYTWTYNVKGNEVEICNTITYDAAVSPKPTGIVTVPSSLGGKVVTHVGDKAFYYCDGLTGVVIPSSVTEIGSEAFRGCSRLANITIPNSVTNIKQLAFERCLGLSNVKLSDNIVDMGRSVFYGCSNLTSVTLPVRVVNIEESVFYGCSGLTNITILGNLVNIGAEAFYKCSGLINMAIPNSVTNIGGAAFYNCSNLTNITLPNGITSLEWHVFDGCRSLTNITIPNSVTNVGGYAFSGCRTLLCVNIPNNVTSIGTSAFFGCSGLRCIVMPTNEMSIADSAFNGCNSVCDVNVPGWQCHIPFGNVTNLVIAPGVTSVGYRAFDGCSSLKCIDLPDSLGSIGSYAFRNCKGLISVSIPNSVASIGEYAFSGCSRLENVTIPDSMTTIGARAFSGCSNLANIAIPDSVRSIGQYAFNGCNLSLYDTASFPGVKLVDGWAIGITSIVSGSLDLTGVRGIGNYVFSDCTNLTNVTISDSITSIGTGAFSGCSGLMSVYITDISAWCRISFGNSSANPLSYAHKLYLNGSLITNLTIPDSVTGIGNWAFSDYTNLTSVTIPNSVTSVGDSAFKGDTSLTNVVFYGDKPSMGIDVFSGVGSDCTVFVRQDTTGWSVNIPGAWNGLKIKYIGDTETDVAFIIRNGVLNEVVLFGATSVTVPEGVTEIGAYAFYGCNAITNVTLPDSVRVIGEHAFDGCTKVTSIAIPDNVTDIPAYAFSGCSGLTSVTIPNSVTTIGEWAFSGCRGLKRLVVPNSVNTIGYAAFAECEGLVSVSLPFVGSSRGYDLGYVGEDRMFGYVFVVGGGSTCRFRFDLNSPWISFGLPAALEEVHITDENLICPYAFYFCEQLKFLELNEGVTAIGEYALVDFGSKAYNSNGEHGKGGTLIIPGTVRFIDSSALSSIDGNIVFKGNAPEFNSSYINGSGQQAKVYVPSASTGWETEKYGGVMEFWKGEPLFRYNDMYILTLDLGTGDESDNGSILYFPEFEGWSYYPELDACHPMALPMPTRTGYAFNGWRLNSYGTVGTSWNDFPQCLDMNATFVAQWSTNVHTIAFDANGGNGGWSGNLEYGTRIDIPEVTRTGYQLIGWLPAVPVTVPDEEMTYVAQWMPCKYTVTFDANGGIGSTTNEEDYASAIIAPVVSYEGYTFTGWLPEVDATVPASNVTYTAQWAINQYTVAFDANGGEGATTTNQNYGTEIVVPEVTRIGYAFNGWLPEVDATVPASNVTYTAQWAINQYTVAFDTNGGVSGTESVIIEHGATVGDLPVPTRESSAFLGWFTEAEGGDVVDESLIVTAGMTLYAHWLTEVANPVIVSDAGVVFRTDSCTVTITCETEGAVIYYTDDGTTPRMNDDYLYAGPITISETTTFKAVAVFGDIRSDYVTVTITKRLTLGEALDVGEGITVATSATLPWTPVFDSMAKVGDATARSGVIGNRTNTWLSATVSGAGTMTFWYKTSCEHDEDNTFTWDRLVVYTNDVEITDWRMDGETGWTQRELTFEGGENTIKWVYYKDKSDSAGEDCAWVDGITWTPSGADAGLAAWLAERNMTADAQAANGRTAAECYALGLDPTDATNDFRIASIELVDGKPKVEWEPKTNRWTGAKIQAVLKGAERLEGPWADVPTAGNPAFRFFKVVVEVP